MTAPHNANVTVELLTPAEVGDLFRVTPTTVSRWAAEGRLSSFRTLGGHRRFIAAEVRDLLHSTAVHIAHT